jgi:hypothetical protein
MVLAAALGPANTARLVLRHSLSTLPTTLGVDILRANRWRIRRRSKWIKIACAGLHVRPVCRGGVEHGWIWNRGATPRSRVTAAAAKKSRPYCMYSAPGLSAGFVQMRTPYAANGCQFLGYTMAVSDLSRLIIQACYSRTKVEATATAGA